jgi:ubiquinone/menaquinone biosynthesis C-methylase UbiE
MEGMKPTRRVLVMPIREGWERLEAEQIVGVDENWETIDRARARAEELGRTDCLFIFGTSLEIPWRENYFDEAYIEGQCSNEVRRVIKTNGKVHTWQNES